MGPPARGYDQNGRIFRDQGTTDRHADQAMSAQNKNVFSGDIHYR
jgi:hypothetical protein